MPSTSVFEAADRFRLLLSIGIVVVRQMIEEETG